MASRYEKTRCLRRSWVFERVGWCAIAVAVLAAAAGLFGGGSLSRAVAAGPDFTAQYRRFGRAHAPQELRVELVPRGATAELWIGRPFLDQLELQQIVPEPDSAAAGSDRVHYSFRVRESGAPLQVRFTVKPARGGRLSGRVGAGESAGVEIRQFVFP